MLLTIPVLLALLAGAILSYVVTRMAIKWQVLDHPNTRSLHTVSTPKAGGIGLMAGMGVPLAAMAFGPGFGSHGAQIFWLILLAMLTGLLGLYDDIRDLPAKLKFLILALFSLALSALVYPVSHFYLDQGQIVLPFFLAVLGTALWVFVLSNASNFMDGADGLIASSAIIAGAGLTVLALDQGQMLVAVLALALIFSLLGFLPLNIARARIFLGDTGALFIGFWLAGVALLYIENGPPGALYAVVLIFMPWLSDILLTMAWRARHRHDLLSAHNDHLYQLFLRRGLSHGQMALFMALQTAVCVALAWVFRASATSELLALTAMAIFAIIIHWWARAIMASPSNPASGDNEAAPEH
jgi:UDP-N-acetylmuramyl pentapeptide phosphotransferase/UDP-N-acetylglucosamine-1-phosphate transferase